MRAPRSIDARAALSHIIVPVRPLRMLAPSDPRVTFCAEAAVLSAVNKQAHPKRSVRANRLKNRVPS